MQQETACRLIWVSSPGICSWMGCSFSWRIGGCGERVEGYYYWCRLRKLDAWAAGTLGRDGKYSLVRWF
jgi:hypothetical protein